MRRVGYLYEPMCSFEHLGKAFRAAFRGTKTAESYCWSFYQERRLLELSAQLKSHTYQPDPYRYFTIYEPKERVISVASFTDRVVHHAIVMQLSPLYERWFIEHSYATRKGKGQHKAIGAAQAYLRRYEWYLKCDIRKYFDHIVHNVLLAQLTSKIKDKAFLQLIERIVRNAGGDKGLPIGNLTSQFLANVYLNAFDHFVKRDLKIPGYVRYMDDFVLFANDKHVLKEALQHIESYLTTHLHLSLKEKAVKLNQQMHGLTFLGRRIYGSTVRFHRENAKRALKNIKKRRYQFERGEISREKLDNCLRSGCANLGSYNTLAFRCQLYGQQVFRLEPC